jgi:pyridoxal phosphate enzyme (YggS family)
MSIEKNIFDVRAEIAAAAERSGRDASAVTLIAVSKTRPAEAVAEAVLAGTYEFGENRVQELLDKQAKIQDIDSISDKIRNIKWNLIGHLQRNKVKSVVDRIALLHSLDSFRLAEEINLRAGALGIGVDVLIQINAGSEEQKTGVAPGECEQFLADVTGQLPNLRVRGLMAVVPFADNPEDVRSYFRETKALFDKLAAYRGSEFTALSMGMTGDYKVAVEEGSTMVRVGTAIFGEREY